MAKKYIIGNWKSNKQFSQLHDWVEKLAESEDLPAGKAGLRAESHDKVAVVCPPFTMLAELKRLLEDKHIALELGAQNISPFAEGAYTGEVTAGQVKELANYTIIGHSERREHFSETPELLEKKVQLAKIAGLQVIFCVQGKETPIPEGVDIVAYEPIFAIGSGIPDTPENAEEVSAYLKNEKGATVVLYGGSVKPENIASFTAQTSIDGALVGGASLEADSFLSLIRNA